MLDTPLEDSLPTSLDDATYSSSSLLALPTSLYENGELYDAIFASVPVDYASKLLHVSEIVRERIENSDSNIDLLDLGCGTGTFCVLASKHFRKVVGIDFATDLIRCGKLKSATCPNVTLIEADFLKFSFRDETTQFQLLTCLLGVIHSFESELQLEAFFRFAAALIVDMGLFLIEFVETTGDRPVEETPILRREVDGSVLLVRLVRELKQKDVERQRLSVEWNLKLSDEYRSRYDFSEAPVVDDAGEIDFRIVHNVRTWRLSEVEEVLTSKFGEVLQVELRETSPHPFGLRHFLGIRKVSNSSETE